MTTVIFDWPESGSDTRIVSFGWTETVPGGQSQVRLARVRFGYAESQLRLAIVRFDWPRSPSTGQIQLWLAMIIFVWTELSSAGQSQMRPAHFAAWPGSPAFGVLRLEENVGVLAGLALAEMKALELGVVDLVGGGGQADGQGVLPDLHGDVQLKASMFDCDRVNIHAFFYFSEFIQNFPIFPVSTS